MKLHNIIEGIRWFGWKDYFWRWVMVFAELFNCLIRIVTLCKFRSPLWGNIAGKQLKAQVEYSKNKRK